MTEPSVTMEDMAAFNTGETARPKLNGWFVHTYEDVNGWEWYLVSVKRRWKNCAGKKAYPTERQALAQANRVARRAKA